MHDHGSLNRTYRLVFNEALGAMVAVPETARGHSRGGTEACVPATGLTLRRLAVAMAMGLSATGGWALDATTLPQGGQVAAGQAQIGVSGSTLSVNQGSERAIINWHSFDIGSGASVKFVQPSASSVALNRVGGGQASQIFGALQANGQVYLVNPAGILFGKTAQVDVGGLVASTLAMRDDDFLAGRDRFGGAGPGSVVNEGRITVQRGGRAVLLGRTVRNTGQISAPSGDVALVAGEQATLSVGANGHLQIAVDAAQVATLAANGGLIEADGGQVILTAKGADALAASVVSNTGTIQARTVANQQGRILLLGDMEHGTVEVAGTLDASAPAGGNGGFAETSAAHVQVSDGARITTQATAGQSGEWLIDPTDFTIGPSGTVQTTSSIAADTLSANLATGTVKIATVGTGNEAGDIHVNAPVSWDKNTLTLSAHRDINVNAVMTASGTAGLELNYGGTDGSNTATPAGGSTIRMALSDSGFTGRVDFTGTSNTLRINGINYTIIRALGTPSSTTGTDLQGMTANSSSARYALGANIDAKDTETWNSGAGFKPISFDGIFEGLGHTVDNLHINRPAQTAVGLFSQTYESVVRNVGLAGGSIVGKDNVGSLVGQNVRASILSSYSTATVQGDSSVGGLVGFQYPDSTNAHSLIADSYATGQVTGGSSTSSGSAGGLLGRGSGTIRNSYATGTVQGRNNVGGLVGLGYSGMAVSTSYATGAVTGTVGVGGLLGALAGSSSVTDSYATGKVSGTQDVGGLVGANTGSSTIADSYATGGVAGQTSPGGLVGRNEAGSTIAASFWNSDTGGVANGVGTGDGTGVTAKDSTEMQQLATFAAVWDIDDAGGTGRVWRIYEGHTTPLLRGFLTGLTVAPVLPAQTYNGATVTSSYTSPDPAIQDTLTYTTTGANAGTYDTAAGTLQLSGALYSHQQGYDISYGNASLTIDRKLLSIGGLVAQNKEYDGNNIATVRFNGLAAGVVGSDDVRLAQVTATFADPNVGTKTVTLTGGTLAGNQAGNYAIADLTGLGLTARIDPKALAGTITADNKVYDGTTAASTSGSLTGVIAGDTVGIATIGNFADKNVGQGKIVNLTGALTGAGAGNYTLAANATTTANIDAAQLLVSANDAQHVADGLPYYGGNGVQFTGFVPGEDASVLGGNLLWGGTGQGALQPGGYSLAVSGLIADNYRIAYGDGLLTILAAVQPTPVVTQPVVTQPTPVVTQPTPVVTQPIPDATPTLVAGQFPTDVGQIDRITRQTLPRSATGDTLRSANSQVPLTVMENYLRVD